MTRCGLTEFKVTSASSSSALNITKVYVISSHDTLSFASYTLLSTITLRDLRYNRLRQIPLAVLTNPSLVEYVAPPIPIRSSSHILGSTLTTVLSPHNADATFRKTR